MKDEELKAQINDIIEGEIQNGINDYLEDKESKQKEQGMGFVNPDEGDELKVKVNTWTRDKYKSLDIFFFGYFNNVSCADLINIYKVLFLTPG